MTTTATATTLELLVQEAITTTRARPVTRQVAVEAVAAEVDALRKSEGPARWQHLLPLTEPDAEREQYAFEVDLDRCTGCKACVAGCHNANGLEAEEIWRTVGDILPTPDATGATITSSCHHCLNPECMNGCPVEAYEKDPWTGIVRHLDDQCIGCQHCVLKCPYGVPQYSQRLGIVRKCDMCSDRLTAGEAPACVQACPNEAIRIVVVDRQETRRRIQQTFGLSSAAPDPALTLPTTRYIGSREWPATPPPPTVEPAHWPLVILLVLTQAGIGLALPALASWMPEQDRLPVLAAASMLSAAGLAVAPLHLGRPLAAWRAFLGVAHSWISRELILFSLFLPLLLTSTFGAILPGTPLHSARLDAFTVLIGLAGVAASAMIYIDTPRRLWRSGRTMVLFLNTVAVGAAVALVTCPSLQRAAALLAAALLVAGLAAEIIPVLRSPELTGTRALWAGPLRRLVVLRLVFAAATLAALAIVVVTPISGSVPILAIVLPPLLASALLERLLFFRAVVAPRMPGWEEAK